MNTITPSRVGAWPIFLMILRNQQPPSSRRRQVGDWGAGRCLGAVSWPGRLQKIKTTTRRLKERRVVVLHAGEIEKTVIRAPPKSPVGNTVYFFTISCPQHCRGTVQQCSLPGPQLQALTTLNSRPHLVQTKLSPGFISAQFAIFPSLHTRVFQDTEEVQSRLGKVGFTLE